MCTTIYMRSDRGRKASGAMCLINVSDKRQREETGGEGGGEHNLVNRIVIQCLQPG